MGWVGLGWVEISQFSVGWVDCARTTVFMGIILDKVETESIELIHWSMHTDLHFDTA